MIALSIVDGMNSAIKIPVISGDSLHLATCSIREEWEYCEAFVRHVRSDEFRRVPANSFH